MENSNAKQFALQLGALISLYVSIGALIQLLFGIITIQFPDPLAGYWEISGASSSMRLAIALLVVFFPAYVALTRTINVARRLGTAYLAFTKWLIYLSLLLGGIVLLGDLVSVIYNFLNGELTVRFLLKALTVLVVVGAAFAYYIFDARGYWETHESRSKNYGFVVALLVLVVLIAGYKNIETPSEVRERTADERVISDLRDLQSFIASYYSINNALPERLEDLEFRGDLPVAPQGREAYTYTKVSPVTFELCGEFAYPTQQGQYSYAPYETFVGYPIKNPDDWTHKAGTWCFTRAVDPSTIQVPIKD